MAKVKTLDDSQRVRMDNKPKPMDTGMKAYDANDRKLLDRIYQNINRYFRFNENNINRFRNDRYFVFYDQWSQDERQAFKDLNKPIFTYNKIYDYYRKLIGEQRFNTSNIEVNSINGMISQKEVTLRADIIRGIEYKSRADIAYQNAFGSAVSGGLGAIRLRTDYVNPKTMEQEILIEPVKFAERVFWDPLSKAATKTDGNFMGIYDQMDKDDFVEKYPEIPYPVSFPVNYNTRYFNWGDKKSITICEYYEKQWYNFTLYQLDNGECISKKEYNRRKKEFDAGQLEAAMPENKAPEQPNTGIEGGQEQMSLGESQIHPQEPATPTPIPQFMGTEQQQPIHAERPMAGKPEFPKVVATRKSRDYKIICYKAIFGHILEQYEWPSKEFPFAIVLGDEVVIDGEHIIVSITRYAKDPQRFLNFLASDLAQAAKNNRREQFLVTADNIAGYEQFWKNPANQAGALPYNPDSVTKQPPVRLPPPELPQTLVQNLQQADRDLRSIMGYQQENEPRMFGNLSGEAIREIQRDGNSTNLVFFNNLERAQEQVGRTILSMLPRIYDTERNITIQGIDGKSSQVTVNKKVAGGIINDLTKGEFDIRVTGGTNYAVRKEEALMAIQQIIASWNPQVSPLVADIIAKNVEMEDGIELVNRFKTLVPPEVLAKADGKPMPPPPPNPQQQQMMQMQQMQQQLESAKLQLAQEEVQSKREQTVANRELNQVKMQQALIDGESSKIRAYSELQKAGFDYKASMIQSAAKIAQAHSDVAEKHFQHLTEIHNLQQTPMEQVAPDQQQKNVDSNQNQ